MKLVSWNVNGIRACLRKGFRDYFEQELPDILCIQETKAEPSQVDLDWVEELGYQHVWNCAEKKGYSGTAIWSRIPFAKSKLGIGKPDHDGEGRVVTVEFDDFQLVTVYTPNSQRGLTRLDYRQQWDVEFAKFVSKLNRKLPVIFCGDLNCAHKEIDLANPKANRKNAGFTDEERLALDRFIDFGFVDCFRQFDQSGGKYSWWTVRSNAREKNIGWRLDYFFAAQSLMPRVKNAEIQSAVMGSDHCPVTLELD